MKNYDLAVAYRIYPGVSKTPIVFRDNKLKLAEVCLQSFKQSLGALNVKVWALLDNCPPEYEALFRRYFSDADLQIVHLPGLGNLATFGVQLDLLLRQKDSENVYFAEDDYFYLPDQFETMLKFLRSSTDVHFIAPFDHPDFYRHELHASKSTIRIFGGRHWRSASSSCLTFLTTQSALTQCQTVFRSYTRNNLDGGVWLSLTKHRVFNPIFSAVGITSNSFLIKTVAKAWFFGWRQILFGKTWKLWVPIPTAATMIEEDNLELTRDWQTLIRDAADRLV